MNWEIKEHAQSAERDKRVYFKLLSLLMLGICSYTDIRQRRIYKRTLILYGIPALCGKIYGVFAQLPTASTGEILWEIFLSLLPGFGCLILSCISGEALGYGDSFLVLICGLSLGLEACICVLFAAFLFSGFGALLLLSIKRKSRKYEMPFVPFLFLGMFILTMAG